MPTSVSSPKTIDDTCVNALRFLAVDAVERAGSGHPGMPLGAAPMAYVLQDPKGRSDVTLLATGSEVHLALDAAATLEDRSIHARVVSMPSMERFETQPEAYRHDVLPPEVPIVAIEAGITRGWHHLVGDGGAVIGLDRFGLSGPGEDVYEELGFTVEHVVNTVHEILEPRSQSTPTALE